MRYRKHVHSLPNHFIFTDESGVVKTDPTQPYFGIGLLKLERVGRWNHNLNRILEQAVSAQAAAGGSGGRRFEFKFNLLKRENYAHYQKLIDYFIAQPDAYFNAFIVDKNQPGVNIESVYSNSWDALLGYSYQVINANIRNGENVIVISDNYQKPKAAGYFYEEYMLSRLGDRVLNVTMADSTAFVLLQSVDVLLGCVMYHYKRKVLPVRNTAKESLSNHLAAAYLGRSDLCGKWTCRTKPNYFSVWPFIPRSPA